MAQFSSSLYHKDVPYVKCDIVDCVWFNVKIRLLIFRGLFKILLELCKLRLNFW